MKNKADGVKNTEPGIVKFNFLAKAMSNVCFLN